jgi:hypothetical protein
MRNIYRGIALLGIVLSGCATNVAPITKPGNDVSIVKVNEVQKKIASCVAEVNQSDDAKYVDEHILVLTEKSPNAKELFNSSDKIASDQAAVLERFKESTLKCRAIANELPSPALVAVYTNFYTNIDAVYKDLIDKRITIGVANQERSMRIQYAKDRWAQILKTEKGGS